MSRRTSLRVDFVVSRRQTKRTSGNYNRYQPVARRVLSRLCGRASIGDLDTVENDAFGGKRKLKVDYPLRTCPFFLFSFFFFFLLHLSDERELRTVVDRGRKTGSVRAKNNMMENRVCKYVHSTRVNESGP